MIKIAGVQFGTLTGGPSSINLSELGDVSISSPLTGNYLRYNSGISEWQNSYLVSSDITTALTYTPVNKAGDTMTGDLIVPSANGGPLAGFRNKIINGGMDISQRGTTFTTAAGYNLDRWQLNYNTSTGVFTVTKNSDVPSSTEFTNSLRVAVTTADTSIAAGEYAILSQRLEGYNIRDLIGKTFTISFWVRSSKTGIHCVSLNNTGQDRSYVSEYTINSANTWEKKSITITNGLITAGTWNWANGNGLSIIWTMACGSTFQSSANSWNTGIFFATSSQVNCLDTIGNIFAITGVQVEIGSVATPFEQRPYGVELSLCQRYYEKSYSDGVAVPTGTTSGLAFTPAHAGTVAAGAAYGSVRFSTPKRVSASISIYSYANSTLGVVSNAAGTDLAASSGGTTYEGTAGFTVVNSSAGTLTPANGGFIFHWAAYAEL